MRKLILNSLYEVTFYMEDNFNIGQANSASGTPNAVNVRFAELGCACEFKHMVHLLKR